MPVIDALKRRDIPAARRALAAAQEGPSHALTGRLLNALDDARVAADP